MSEVKRFHRDDDEFERYECEFVVDAKDFDRVTAEREGLQAMLTAADERADVLEGLLRRVVESSVLSFEKDAPESLESLEADICAALKPAECCTVSAQDRALLEAGDYTPEELFGIGGKPSCPKCAK